MGNLQEDLVQLLSYLYCAPGDEQNWKLFLTKFAQTAGAEQGLLIHHDRVQNRTNINCEHNLDHDYANSYNSYYQYLNPYLSSSLIAHPSQGTFGVLNELIPDKEVMKTEFFHDYVLPQELTVKNAIRLTPLLSEDVFTSIALHSAKSETSKCPKNALKLCELLMPHLQNALELHRKIVSVEVGMDSIFGMFDLMPFGVALFDRKGSLVVINKPAREIVAQNDGLSLKNGNISAAVLSQSISIATMLRNASQLSHGIGVEPIGISRITRPSGKRSYEMLILPVYENRKESVVSKVSSAVFIFDLESEKESLDVLLARLYDLTRAEVNVLKLLLQGHSATQISDRFSLSRETVKTHLRHIFQKTETNRQSELVSVVLRGVPMMHPFEGNVW